MPLGVCVGFRLAAHRMADGIHPVQPHARLAAELAVQFSCGQDVGAVVARSRSVFDDFSCCELAPAMSIS